MTDGALDRHLPTEVRRTRYFDGQLLTAADFERDQQYHRDLRYLHNRALGFGIVEGLKVHPSTTGISITPGFAIDALGRELVLADTEHLALDDTLLAAQPQLRITATWSQVEDGSSWLERPVIAIEPALAVRPPSLVLARIRHRRRKGLLIDVTSRDAFRPRAHPSPTRSSNG